MTWEEKEFVEFWYKVTQEENERHGIIFPFLVTKNWSNNRIIRAKQIFSSKEDRSCFACLTYQNPGAAKRKSPYNGVFFSSNIATLEEEGLVEVAFYSIKSNVTLLRTLDRDGSDMLTIHIEPIPEALEHFFQIMDAVYVNDKSLLKEDYQISF